MFATISEAAEQLAVSRRFIEKLIEEADSSKKSRWRWGHELIELTPRSSTKRVIRINLQAVCPALNVIPVKAIAAGPVDS